MAEIKESFDVPLQAPLVEYGALSSVWAWFFRRVFERLYSLGSEQSFELQNGQTTAADIEGMKFDKRGASIAFVDYLVQRITTGASAQELVEGGTLIFVYKPTSETWVKVTGTEDKPVDAGITFSITSDGQVQYTTTSITGTTSISRIVWRARTMSAKHSSYSVIGAR